MCFICDNLKAYNELYPLGLILDDLSVSKLVAYFSLVNNIKESCTSSIRALALKKIKDGEDMPFSVYESREWLAKQCFYKLFMSFKEKTNSEKFEINQELKYLFSSF